MVDRHASSAGTLPSVLELASLCEAVRARRTWATVDDDAGYRPSLLSAAALAVALKEEEATLQTLRAELIDAVCAAASETRQRIARAKASVAKTRWRNSVGASAGMHDHGAFRPGELGILLPPVGGGKPSMLSPCAAAAAASRSLVALEAESARLGLLPWLLAQAEEAMSAGVSEARVRGIATLEARLDADMASAHARRVAATAAVSERERRRRAARESRESAGTDDSVASPGSTDRVQPATHGGGAHGGAPLHSSFVHCSRGGSASPTSRSSPHGNHSPTPSGSVSVRSRSASPDASPARSNRMGSPVVSHRHPQQSQAETASRTLLADGLGLASLCELVTNQQRAWRTRVAPLYKAPAVRTDAALLPREPLEPREPLVRAPVDGVAAEALALTAADSGRVRALAVAEARAAAERRQDGEFEVAAARCAARCADFVAQARVQLVVDEAIGEAVRAPRRGPRARVARTRRSPRLHPTAPCSQLEPAHTSRPRRPPACSPAPGVCSPAPARARPPATAFSQVRTEMEEAAARAAAEAEEAQQAARAVIAERARARRQAMEAKAEAKRRRAATEAKAEAKAEREAAERGKASVPKPPSGSRLTARRGSSAMVTSLVASATLAAVQSAVKAAEATTAAPAGAAAGTQAHGTAAGLDRDMAEAVRAQAEGIATQLMQVEVAGVTEGAAEAAEAAALEAEQLAIEMEVRTMIRTSGIPIDGGTIGVASVVLDCLGWIFAEAVQRCEQRGVPPPHLAARMAATRVYIDAYTERQAKLCRQLDQVQVALAEVDKLRTTVIELHSGVVRDPASGKIARPPTPTERRAASGDEVRLTMQLEAQRDHIKDLGLTLASKEADCAELERKYRVKLMAWQRQLTRRLGEYQKATSALKRLRPSDFAVFAEVMRRHLMPRGAASGRPVVPAHHPAVAKRALANTLKFKTELYGGLLSPRSDRGPISPRSDRGLLSLKSDGFGEAIAGSRRASPRGASLIQGHRITPQAPSTAPSTPRSSNSLASSEGIRRLQATFPTASLTSRDPLELLAEAIFALLPELLSPGAPPTSAAEGEVDTPHIVDEFGPADEPLPPKAEGGGSPSWMHASPASYAPSVMITAHPAHAGARPKILNGGDWSEEVSRPQTAMPGARRTGRADHTMGNGSADGNAHFGYSGRPFSACSGGESGGGLGDPGFGAPRSLASDSSESSSGSKGHNPRLPRQPVRSTGGAPPRWPPAGKYYGAAAEYARFQATGERPSDLPPPRATAAQPVRRVAQQGAPPLVPERQFVPIIPGAAPATSESAGCSSQIPSGSEPVASGGSGSSSDELREIGDDADLRSDSERSSSEQSYSDERSRSDERSGGSSDEHSCRSNERSCSDERCNSSNEYSSDERSCSDEPTDDTPSLSLPPSRSTASQQPPSQPVSLMDFGAEQFLDELPQSMMLPPYEDSEEGVGGGHGDVLSTGSGSARHEGHGWRGSAVGRSGATMGPNVRIGTPRLAAGIAMVATAEAAQAAAATAAVAAAAAATANADADAGADANTADDDGSSTADRAATPSPPAEPMPRVLVRPSTVGSVGLAAVAEMHQIMAYGPSHLVSLASALEPESVDGRTLRILEPLVTDPNMSKASPTTRSVAASTLCQWVRAIDEYARSFSGTGDGWGGVQEAEREKDAALATIDELREDIAEERSRLAILERKTDFASQRREELTAAAEDAEPDSVAVQRPNQLLELIEETQRTRASIHGRPRQAALISLWHARHERLEAALRQLPASALVVASAHLLDGYLSAADQWDLLASIWHRAGTRGLPLPSSFVEVLSTHGPSSVKVSRHWRESARPRVSPLETIPTGRGWGAERRDAVRKLAEIAEQAETRSLALFMEAKGVKDPSQSQMLMRELALSAEVACAPESALLAP